jgi:hypothetical protein
VNLAEGKFLPEEKPTNIDSELACSDFYCPKRKRNKKRKERRTLTKAKCIKVKPCVTTFVQI